MRIAIEGKQYQLPSSLNDITLGQRIAFEKQYGEGLREQLKKAQELKNEQEKELEFTDYHCRLACCTLSFFGGIPLEIVEQTNISEVLAVYHHTMKLLSEDIDFANKEAKLENSFEWNGDTWLITAPELKHDGQMTFGEFLDAKQWVKNLWELGNGKWDALLMLCCVYFRKDKEKYHEDLAKAEGERYLLLQQLPLPHALQVGFFLSGSMNSYVKTLHSSNQEAAPADQK